MKVISKMLVLLIVFFSCGNETAKTKAVENQDSHSIGENSANVGQIVQDNIDCGNLKLSLTKNSKTKFDIDFLESIDLSSLDKLESKVYNQYFSIFSELEGRDVYLVSFMDQWDCSFLVVSSIPFDGGSKKLHLINLNANESSNILTLAEESNYPGSQTIIESKLRKGGLVQELTDSFVGDYIESEDRYQQIDDKIITEFKIELNGTLVQVKKDSLRSISN